MKEDGDMGKIKEKREPTAEELHNAWMQAREHEEKARLAHERTPKDRGSMACPEQVVQRFEAELAYQEAREATEQAKHALTVALEADCLDYPALAHDLRAALAKREAATNALRAAWSEAQAVYMAAWNRRREVADQRAADGLPAPLPLPADDSFDARVVAIEQRAKKGAPAYASRLPDQWHTRRELEEARAYLAKVQAEMERGSRRVRGDSRAGAGGGRAAAYG